MAWHGPPISGRPFGSAGAGGCETTGIPSDAAGSGPALFRSGRLSILQSLESACLASAEQDLGTDFRALPAAWPGSCRQCDSSAPSAASGS